jgi:hypothetical protein
VSRCRRSKGRGVRGSRSKSGRVRRSRSKRGSGGRGRGSTSGGMKGYSGLELLIIIEIILIIFSRAFLLSLHPFEDTYVGSELVGLGLGGLQVFATL